METGVGRNTVDIHASDPKVMMRYSDDGGHLWSSNREASLGRIGEYRKQVGSTVSALPPSRPHLRVSISAPVRRAIIRGSLEAEALRA